MIDEPERIKLVADVALYSKGRVLLVKYRDTTKYDGQEGWFLPDDYLRRLEHPEDGALRILREQVGVDVPRLDLRFIESFEGNGAWHVVFHYSGEPAEEPRIRAGSITAKAEWFDMNALPGRSDMAHGGWALDVLAAMRKGREETPHVRSVVD